MRVLLSMNGSLGGVEPTAGLALRLGAHSAQLLVGVSLPLVTIGGSR